jgi:1-acyl-sn-glycerol-3-phosphate acyltransferase
MSQPDDVVRAPSAEAIERRLRNPLTHVVRPLIWAIIELLCVARRFRWVATGVEALRAADEPLIFVANHASHVDTAAILATLPKPIRTRTVVAAALDVFGSTGTGPKRSWKRECIQLLVAAGFRAFAFDRHGPPLRSIRTSAQLIRGGWNLLLFPEGTRSRDGSMQPFKAGVGVLARFTARPVVPIHVEGGAEVLPCGAMMPRAGRIIVRFGRPLVYRGDEPAEAFAARVQEAVGALAASAPAAPAAAPRQPRARLVTRLRRLAFGS